METTRHFTATTYVVRDGATLLHDHERLDRWLPPGGHVDRDELPHEAAVREVREETGLDVDLVAETEDVASDAGRAIPKPRHFMLYDIDVWDGRVGHQHVDFVFYARASNRTVSPADGEVAADDWEWFGPDALRTDDRLDSDVSEIGRRAIETVAGVAPE